MSIDEVYLQKLMRTLSHDVGGTLRCSVGFSKLILDNYSDVLDEKAIKWLKLIKADGEKTQGELVALSRYARLYDVADSEAVCNLTELCKKAIDDAGVDEFYAGVTIKVDAMPSVNGYERLWVDLFAELIVNALKHNYEHKGLTCRVFSRELEDGLQVIIADNGAGLDVKQKEMAMLPFRPISQDNLKGVGMGLAISKRIAELQGGSLSLEEPGDGEKSGFWAVITLPKDSIVGASR